MTLAPRPIRAGARRAAIAAVRALPRAVLLVAGALLLAACSSGSDGTERQLKAAATATATAQTALSAWLAGDAPADYARRTVRTMRERLAAAAEEVVASEDGGAARRAELLNPMRQAGAALGRAEAAIAAGRRGDAERARAEAATAASSFTAPAARNRPPPR
ncbi:MAG: hypothetical protein ACJ8DG_05955 [Microvirga sp.]